MKKVFLCIALVALLMLPGFAEGDFDAFLSSATTQDLLALRDDVNAAIEESDMWESVNVPVGIYEVGVDIPAGKWAVSAGNSTSICEMMIGDVLSDNGKEINYWDASSYFSFALCNEWLYKALPELQRTVEIVDIPEGYYVEISEGSVIFETYTGHPDFKFFAEEMPSGEVTNRFNLDEVAFDVLVSMKDRLNFEIWNSYGWENILVPHGIYKIGVNIPVGHWTVEPPIGSYIDINYGSELNAHQMNMELNYDAWNQSLLSETYSRYDEGDVTKTDVNMVENYFACINDGVYAWFSPYEGKANLGFKALG